MILCKNIALLTKDDKKTFLVSIFNKGILSIADFCLSNPFSLERPGA